MPAPEYVLDVPYPRKYVADVAPPRLRLVAALNGIAAPPEDDFDYCDLGCANGDTLALLAAANPDARFVGVDVSPSHASFARELARRGSLANVRILERDFADLGRDALPAFDFIVAHGIWSWVSPQKRAAILAFVRDRLKPGGLFFASYDAMPGWAAMAPLRRLLLERAAAASGSTLDRAREAVAYVQRLVDSGGSTYFAQHPTVKQMVALMQSAGLPYVVHEYFHAHHEPFYSADVEREMAGAGLSFIGQLPLHLNVRELATPPNVRKMAEAIADRPAFETLKDYATNELFRSDVFVKGRAERSESETRFYFEGTRMGTMAAKIRREAKLPHYTVDYGGAVYDAIVKALEEGAATGMELAQRRDLAGLGQSRIGDCLGNLVLGGQVVPMRSPGAPLAGPARLGVPHDEVAMEEALSGGGPLALASPVTGAGVHLSLLEMIALRMLTLAPGADPKAWLDGFAAKVTFPLVVGDAKIKDRGELARTMTRELDRVRAMLPKLAELGVVAG